MAHHPVYAYIYVSTLLQSHFTTQQATMSSWTGDDMMTPSVQHCGASKIQRSTTIFQSYTREISNPSEMIESTNQIKW
jgi:hypothetical protein